MGRGTARMAVGKNKRLLRARKETGRRPSIHSPRRIGTMSRHLPSSPTQTSARPWSPGLPAPRSPLTVLRGVCSKSPSETSTRARMIPSARSVSCGGHPGQELPHQLLGHEVHHRQAPLPRPQVAITDRYLLRLFCIGFTKRRQFQIRKTSYAQSAQIRAIRKKMTDIMTKEVSSVELIKAVEKFIPEYIGKDIQKACEGIYPLQNVYIRKVKILKAPKFDAAKLAEIHAGDTGAEVGAKIARAAEAEAAVTAE